MFPREYDKDEEGLGPSDLRGKRNLGIEAGIADEQGGSAERYRARIPKFEDDGKPLPKLRHHALWMLHNLVAHPVLGVLPTEPAIEFHELTSMWLNHVAPPVVGERTFFRNIRGSKPVIERPALWALHNLVGHVAIGLLPCKATFKLHDWTAKLMRVPGWV
jgi:hypothetical protein